MKVAFKDSVLTVVTNISEATAKKGYASLTVTDEKKGDLYKVSATSGTRGDLSKYGMLANAVVDGNLAVVIPCGIVATKDEVMKVYGDAILAADTYTAVIAAQASEKEAAIAAFFTDAE